MNSARNNAYIYDCNAQNYTALQLLKATLTNPAGSGRKIIVLGYSVPNMSNVGVMGTLTYKPTGALPTTTYAPLPSVVDSSTLSPQNIGVFKANVTLAVSPMTGGTDILTVPVKPADRNAVELLVPLIVMPGETLGWTFSGGLAVTNITFVLHTMEETI